MIKAILLDIDGTLTNAKKEITPKTLAALRKVQASGVRLILASGRPANGLELYADQLGMRQHNGLYCCYNGSQIRNCSTGEIYYNNALSPQQSREILEHLKGFDVVPMIERGEYIYVNNVFNDVITLDGKPFRVMEYEVRSNNCLLCEKRDLAAFCDFPLNKILTYGEPEYLLAHCDELKAPFGDSVNAMFTTSFYFEFTAKGVDKAAAIDAVLPQLGLEREELIAYGDGFNDMSLIKYAGIGVAMGNAVEPLKQAADEVTLSNEEDGIAESLYRHFPALFE